jgi:hypothetical protein
MWNWKDKEDLELLTRAGYASSVERMKAWCEENKIRPTKLVKKIGQDVVEYWAKYWQRSI